MTRDRVLHYILVVSALCLATANKRHTYVHQDVTCLLCPPGSHKVALCNADQPTRCAPCGFNYFMPIYNKAPGCFKCKTSCVKTHQVIEKNCTRTEDAVCQCKDGYYLKHREHPSCKAHSYCPPGYGVVRPGTPDTNTVCAKCKEGTFSSVYSKTQQCLNHTKCEISYSFMGNSTHDAKCSSNTARPSFGTVTYTEPTTMPSNVKHRNNTKESTAIPSNGTNKNDTTGANGHNVVVIKWTIVIAIVVPVAVICACCGCGCRLGWIKYKGYCKKDGDNSNGGGKESLNLEDGMELLEMCAANGAGGACASGPGPSGDNEAKKIELQRSISRSSGSDVEPLMEDNHDAVRYSRQSSCNEGFMSSSDQLDAELEKTEMTLAEFLYKAAEVLGTDSWKRAMRMLPGLPLTDGDIDSIYYDNHFNGIAEIKYECLNKWQKKNPGENVVKSVVETFEKVGYSRQLKNLRTVKIMDS